MEYILGTNVNAILLVVAIVATIVAMCALVFPWLKRKGIDTAATLQAAGGMLDSADTITDILKTVFPTSVFATIADKAIDYAKIGVGKAEQLFLINKITSEDRNAEAKQFTYNALAIAGIERSAAIDRIVDGAIEAAVLMLGHTGKPPDPLEGRGGFD